MRPTDTFSSEINQLTISLGIIIFEVKTFLGVPHILFFRSSELCSFQPSCVTPSRHTPRGERLIRVSQESKKQSAVRHFQIFIVLLSLSNRQCRTAGVAIYRVNLKCAAKL
jgi:hypothetical protein